MVLAGNCAGYRIDRSAKWSNCVYSISLLGAYEVSSGVPRNSFRGGWGSTSSVDDREQRERESGGGSPLVRGSGGSCNLVQEISFHIVNFS